MTDGATGCDVLVAGAGPAGMAAALTAARAGAETLLIEQRPAPGGALAAALCTALCGLYGQRPAGAEDTLNGGVCREVARALDPGEGPRPMGRTFVLPFEVHDLRGWFARACGAEASLTVRCGTAVVAADAAGDRVERVGLCDGTWVRASAVIDCTGGACLACLAGAPVTEEPPAGRQLGGYALRLGGLVGDLSMLPLAVPYHLARAAEAGEVPGVLRFATFALGRPAGEGVVTFPVLPELFGRLDRVEDDVGRAVEALRAAVPAMTEARPLAASPRAVPRDGPRLRGRAVLTEHDVLSARKCGAGGVRAAWPVEFWSPTDGPCYAYVPAGDHYEIPGACLAGAEHRGLFCAGRCLSATPRAAASARVAGLCLATGQLAAQAALDCIDLRDGQ